MRERRGDEQPGGTPIGYAGLRGPLLAAGGFVGVLALLAALGVIGALESRAAFERRFERS